MYGQYYEVVAVDGRDVTLARRGEHGMYSCDSTFPASRRVRIIDGDIPAVGMRCMHPSECAGRGCTDEEGRHHPAEIEHLD